MIVRLLFFIVIAQGPEYLWSMEQIKKDLAIFDDSTLDTSHAFTALQEEHPSGYNSPSEVRLQKQTTRIIGVLLRKPSSSITNTHVVSVEQAQAINKEIAKQGPCWITLYGTYPTSNQPPSVKPLKKRPRSRKNK
jgi:hypothetical protein